MHTPPPTQVFRFGPYHLDVRERLLLRAGEPVALAPKHFDLLAALVRRHGKLATKDELLAEVWPETFVTDASLAQAVSQLRRSLGEPAGAESWIATVPKAGYRLAVAVAVVGVEPVEPPSPTAPAPAGGKSSRAPTHLIAVIVIGCGLLGLVALTERQGRPLAELAVDLAPPEDATIGQLQALFAEHPASVKTGGELARKLGNDGRPQEALAVIARVRQIPGGGDDPWIDSVEAWITNGINQPQRALLLTTRALAHPRTAQDLELSVRLRGVRGRALSVLGRKDEARAELERALAESEKLGDPGALVRNLNDLAIEELSRGDLDRAEQLFERALAITRASGVLNNLASIALLRGRPDLAETRLREAIEISRERESWARLGFSLMLLGDALRFAGKPEEVEATFEQAEALLRQHQRPTDAAMALGNRFDFLMDKGPTKGVEEAATEMERAAATTGDPRTLAMAEMLRGRAAAQRAEHTQAREHFEEARRLTRELGESENWSLLTLAQAELEREAGQPWVATRLAEAAAGPWRSASPNEIVLHADALLARLAAEDDRAEEARRHLERCGPLAETTTSVEARIAFLAARAQVAYLEGDPAAAERDVETGQKLARDSWRFFDELDLESIRVFNETNQSPPRALEIESDG